jgi:hypothetical protein
MKKIRKASVREIKTNLTDAFKNMKSHDICRDPDYFFRRFFFFRIAFSLALNFGVSEVLPSTAVDDERPNDSNKANCAFPSSFGFHWRFFSFVAFFAFAILPFVFVDEMERAQL